MVVVVGSFGLESLEAFLNTTLTQVCWEGAGGVVVEPEALAAAGSGEGAADRRLVRREAFFTFATFMVSVAIFTTMAFSSC